MKATLKFNRGTYIIFLIFGVLILMFGLAVRFTDGSSLLVFGIILGGIAVLVNSIREIKKLGKS